MPNLDAQPVLQRIHQLKKDQPLSDFCLGVGLNYENMKKCFQRKSLPDTESLHKIAEYFQTGMQWLITGTEPSSILNRTIAFRVMDFRISRGWSLEELANRLSVSAQVMELYERGKCLFSAEFIQKISLALDVPPAELLTGPGMLPAQNPHLNIFRTTSVHKSPQISGEDFVSVPLTESAIAAGQPIIPQEAIEDYVLLHIRAAGKRSNLVASRVDGQSMEPVLHSGDIVVIDREDKKIVKNKIFAIYHEGGLTAKFLERKANLLILRPINPNAEIEIIDLNLNGQPIVGKIIGAWKDFE